MRAPALEHDRPRARRHPEPRSSTTTSRRSRCPQLEEFGFCGRGEAKDFIADGNIELGGRLPINTNGGQLGEAYIHGMNGIAEGVRLSARHVDEPAARRSSTHS